MRSVSGKQRPAPRNVARCSSASAAIAAIPRRAFCPPRRRTKSSGDGPDCGQHIPGNETLPASAVKRDEPEQPGDRLRATCMASRFRGRRPLRVKDQRRKLDRAPRLFRRNSLQVAARRAWGRHRGRRCVPRDSRRRPFWADHAVGSFRAECRERVALSRHPCAMASRHHCRRISPGSGSLMRSRIERSRR